MPGGTTRFRAGILEIDDPAGCSVWFKEKLSSPVIIEYTATMIQNGGPNDNARDLNCFWMSIDPKHPTDIFTDKTRGGSFRNYDQLRHYYVGYGGNRNTSTRFRRYNGLGERPLLPQHDLSREEYLITPNEPIRIQIVAIGNRTQYIRNGEVVFDFIDDDPYQQGWFAFRTVKNHIKLEDFRVTRAIPVSGAQADPPLMRLGAHSGGYTIQQVSAGNASAMHAYMDICPESPNGKRILYFEFEDRVPGWGRVVVANRDGSEARYISDRIKGHSHDGARQQWIDDQRVIYGIENQERSRVYDFTDKSTREVDGQIGMVSEINGLGLTHNNYPPTKYGANEQKPAEVLLMDIQAGDTQVIMDKSRVRAMHPLQSLINAPKYQNLDVFKHPKWSPDGSQFFWVYMIKKNVGSRKVVKSAILSNGDGSQIRYVSEIGQHPMWNGPNSLLSYVRHDGFHHSDNPTAQDVMAHPVDGSPGKPIVKNAHGIHGSLSPDGKYFATDVFDWPEPETHSVLLYDVESGDYRILARMRAETETKPGSMHPHPSWSRDGKRIYFNGSDAGNRRLYAIDLSRFEFAPIARR